MKKLYFASPLFSEMERNFNKMLVDKIRESFTDLEVYLPQEAANINDKEAYADSKMIATFDSNEVLSSDIVFAVLDGAIIDPGVASEIGIAYHAGIPVVGLYSDSRQKGATNPKKIEALQEIAESQFSYINLFTVGLVKLNGEVIDNSENVIPTLKKYL